MTTKSTTDIGQTYLTLLRATQLMLGPQGDDLQVDLHLAVTALQLRCLTLVRELIQIPDCTYPETITGCLKEATIQTSQWDLTVLPPEAADFIVDLADLNHVLANG